MLVTDRQTNATKNITSFAKEIIMYTYYVSQLLVKECSKLFGKYKTAQGV